MKIGAIGLLLGLAAIPATAKACDLWIDAGCTIYNQADTPSHHDRGTWPISEWQTGRHSSSAEDRVDRQLQRQQDQMFQDYEAAGPKDDDPSR